MAKAVEARAKLLEAAHTALLEDGYAGASARVVAGYAGMAPGSIYYHFKDLDQLLADSSRVASAASAEVWDEALSRCNTLGELVAEARILHEAERVKGNLVILAQLLSGARGNETLTAVVNENFQLLAAVVEQSLERILVDTPLTGVIDAHQLSRTISAGFVGLELFDDAIPDGTDLFEQLGALASLADEVLGAGWITTQWLRRRLGPPRR